MPATTLAIEFNPNPSGLPCEAHGAKHGRIILIKIGLLSFLKNKDNILRPTLKNEIMEAINAASQNMPVPISIGIVDSGKINNGGIICSIHQIIDFFSRLIFILHTNPH